MMLKIQLSNYILKYIKIENSHFKLSQYYCFSFFSSNKAAFGAQKRLHLETEKKYLTDLKLLTGSIYIYVHIY